MYLKIVNLVFVQLGLDTFEVFRFKFKLSTEGCLFVCYYLVVVGRLACLCDSEGYL